MVMAWAGQAPAQTPHPTQASSFSCGLAWRMVSTVFCARRLMGFLPPMSWVSPCRPAMFLKSSGLKDASGPSTASSFASAGISPRRNADSS